MKPLPVIPKSKIPNHDASHIIREAFQEVLGSSILPKDLADNLEKYKMKMETLRICGVDSNKIYSAHKKIVEDINKIEDKFLKQKAEYLIAEDIINQNVFVKEVIKLKRQAIFRKMDRPSVEKYGLLEFGSLLPSIPERAIDFRLNSNTHLCSPPCRTTFEGLPPLGGKPVSSEKNRNIKRASVRSNKNKNICDLTLKDDAVIKRKAEVVFQAIPELLIFYNYKLNIEYKKKIKLKNLTNVVQKISLKNSLLSEYFSIDLESGSKIARGMNAVYCITYKTDIFNDIRETVSFRASSGQELTVQLMSQRDAPILQMYIVKYDHILTNSETLYSSRSSYNIDRTIALNSTIDCGFSFIGKEIKLSMITKNEGGHGKFFIISEEDWFSLVMEDINLNLKLCAGVFHIFPAYFEIASDEFVNINVSFYPKKHGLFVQTVYILCSNNTFLPLDLIGDGVYFETNFIAFDLPKKDGKPYFFDFDSEYCLHFDQCLACTKVSASIKVNNNSALNLTHRWNVRKSENESGFQFKHMPSHWMTIKPVSCLHSYSATEFELTVIPEISEGGFYHIVLSLYIENIPEVSLLDRETFVVIERPDYSESKLLDVLVGEIEVLCEVQAVRVIIEPNPLNIPNVVTCNNLHKESFSVVNCTDFQLQCKWLPHINNVSSTIKPEEFVLKKNCHCVVHIVPKNYENLEEKFILDVNDGSYKDIFLVKAKVSVLSASLSISTINFGIILVGLNYKQTFYVENNCPETLSWCLVEDVLDQASGNIVSYYDPMTIRPNNGVLRAKEKYSVEYEASNDKCGEWSSHIKLFTNFSKTKTPEFVSSVYFMVCAPDIMMHTNTSEMPIINPYDILHPGVTTDHHVCLHNGGCVDTVFAFGKPTGKGVRDFEIAMVPRLGNIRAKENVHIDVRITPHKMGYYEDILIPCFFLGIDYAYAVRLMCIVGDVMVNIYFPNELGNYNIILWPELNICKSCYCEDAIVERVPKVVSANGNGDDEVIKFLEDSNVKDGEEDFGFLREDCQDNKNISEGNGSLKSSHSHMDVRITPLSFSSYASSSISASLSESTRALSLKEKVKEFFGEDLKLHGHILTFENIPLKTPVKKIIKVQNLTAGSAVVYLEVTNLYCIEQEEDPVRDTMINMNMRKSNEWEDIVSSEGVAIKIQPSGTNLNPFETIEIEVCAYANTWGYYVDELVLDISELAPFCATVIVEVVGAAVEFPLAVNTICNQPTLRLGVVPVNSQEIERKIKVSNISVVPLFITWHCFLKSKDETGAYFGIIFDMNDPDTEEDVQCFRKLKLIKEDLGVATNTHFEIEPEMMLIQPKSHSYVKLTVRVCCFNQDYFYKKIKGYIVGSVHLYKQFKFQQNLYYRPTGTDINLIKLKITGKLEVPRLHLDDLPRVIEITAYASDIVQNFQFAKTKRLIFKNRRLSEALIYMTTEDPFRIISVKTLRYEESRFMNYVSLKPSECLEIILKCVIKDSDVLKLAPIIRLSENMRILSRNIIIYQRSAVQVKIPICLQIFYPSFNVSPKEITFGNVFIGNVAKSVLTLKNMTAAAIPFQVIKSKKCKELIVIPSSDIMQPPSTGEDVILSVFFKPRKPITYEVSIIIATSIPRFEKTVDVVGMGSYNESFYVTGRY